MTPVLFMCRALVPLQDPVGAPDGNCLPQNSQMFSSSARNTHTFGSASNSTFLHAVWLPYPAGRGQLVCCPFSVTADVCLHTFELISVGRCRHLLGWVAHFSVASAWMTPMVLCDTCGDVLCSLVHTLSADEHFPPVSTSVSGGCRMWALEH